MRHATIIQEEPSGCGLACVAMFTGKSDGETKALANDLGILADDASLWSETRYVRDNFEKIRPAWFIAVEEATS